MSNIKIVGSETFPDRAFSWLESTEWIALTFEIPKGDVEGVGKFIDNDHYKPAKYDIKIIKYNPEITQDDSTCVNCGSNKGWFFRFSEEKDTKIKICDNCGKDLQEVFC